jgi:hypothetical protein
MKGAYPTPVVGRWTPVQQTTGDRVAIFIDRTR